MPIPILTISQREEDIVLGQDLAKANNLPHHAASSQHYIEKILTEFPQSIIFWDADHPGALRDKHPLFIKSTNQTLTRLTTPAKVFAVTTKPLNENEELNSLPCFGHHIFRRYIPPAPTLLSKLLGAALVSFPFGIDRYLPEGSESRTIKISQSKQKGPAVQAIQNVLERRGIPARLCSQVAQATDELLMNAIYDAPRTPEGAPLRKNMDRTQNVVLPNGETIELTISSCESYFAICVGDPYGTLKKETVLAFIRQNFKDSEYQPESGGHTGLGINGVIQSGFSLLFVCRPKWRTEVYLFFPKVANYRDFRKGFRFLSLLSE